MNMIRIWQELSMRRLIPTYVYSQQNKDYFPHYVLTTNDLPTRQYSYPLNQNRTGPKSTLLEQMLKAFQVELCQDWKAKK